MIFRIAVKGFALAVLGLAAVAQADEYGPLHDRFELSLGTYFYASSTNVRADAIDGENIGSEINLERAFDFDDETVLRAEGLWRFFPRHKLRFMYFESNRVAENTISEEIDFDGELFPIDALVRAEFDTRIIELAYEYVFVQRDDWELGASLGVHNVKFATVLGAEIDAGEGGEISGELRGDVKTNAPLPVFGLRGTWNVWKDLYLQAQAQYFKVSIDAYDGEIVDAQATLLWNFSRHFGAGIGYNYFRTEVDVEDDDLRGRLRWSYDGAQIFVRAAF